MNYVFIHIVILCAVSYLVGSINFSILILKLAGKGDPREKFSGNAGVTNVYRQCGIEWTILVLLLDIGRSISLYLLSASLIPIIYITWVGFFLILGNSYPCFHEFRGGKGVANYLGFCILLEPFLTIFASLSWCLAYYIFKIPFIGSFAMVSILSGGAIYIFHNEILPIMGVILTSVLIFYRHKLNILELNRKIKAKNFC